MKSNLNCFFKLKDDLIFFQIEDKLNILVAGRRPKEKIMQLHEIKSKTMVVALLKVT
jgi:hypothetical protein